MIFEVLSILQLDCDESVELHNDPDSIIPDISYNNNQEVHVTNDNSDHRNSRGNRTVVHSSDNRRQSTASVDNRQEVVVTNDSRNSRVARNNGANSRVAMEKGSNSRVAKENREVGFEDQRTRSAEPNNRRYHSKMQMKPVSNNILNCTRLEFSYFEMP